MLEFYCNFLRVGGWGVPSNTSPRTEPTIFNQIPPRPQNSPTDQKKITPKGPKSAKRPTIWAQS